MKLIPVFTAWSATTVLCKSYANACQGISMKLFLFDKFWTKTKFVPHLANFWGSCCLNSSEILQINSLEMLMNLEIFRESFFQGVLHPPSPGLDASLLKGYPPAFDQAFLKIYQYPFILLGQERHCESNLFCLRT